MTLKRKKRGADFKLPLMLDWTGTSPSIKLLMSETEALAPLGAPVLINGETGTGKELVARGLHLASNRPGRLISINCACLTDTLVEDTFFGHEKGSFTDARGIREGVFEQADQGTLFLDEIGDLSLNHQAVLLRVLEEKRIRRIGGAMEIPINFRLVTATNRDLHQMVECGAFRSDLYHRVSTLKLTTTPLRFRIEDAVPIAKRLLFDMRSELGECRLDNSAKWSLTRYDWPGNVRELGNRIYRAAALSLESTITDIDLSLPTAEVLPISIKLRDALPNEVHRYVQRFGGNISKAAKSLGLARSTLRDKMKSLNFEEPVDLTGT